MKADRVFLARMVDNQTAGGAFDDEENVVADFTLPAQTFFWLKVLQPRAWRVVHLCIVNNDITKTKNYDTPTSTQPG
jgi:hypothetical protein